jgi:integrase/recombinase XerC
VPGRRRQQVPDRYDAVYQRYAAALRQAPLDEHTRRAYDSRVRGFLAWLTAVDLDGPDPLTDLTCRDLAVRDYLGYLRTADNRAANTVNAHLTALDHFFAHLRLGSVGIRRDKPVRSSPETLDEREQERYLRAVRQRPLPRDRAIGVLLLHSGLRISELAALDTTDLTLTPRKGSVCVRSARGEITRKIPLSEALTRHELKVWTADRASWPRAHDPALFLNRRGGRLSPRAIDQLLDNLATEAELVDHAGRPTASAHTLRHTFARNLLRDGLDVATVAQLMGHARPDAIRRHTHP